MSENARLKCRHFALQGMELFHPADPVTKRCSKSENRQHSPMLELFMSLKSKDTNPSECRETMEEIHSISVKLMKMQARQHLIDISQNVESDVLKKQHLLKKKERGQLCYQLSRLSEQLNTLERFHPTIMT